MKSIFPIKSMLGPDGFRKQHDDYTQLKNPITDCLNLHLGHVETAAGNDNYEAWEGRGNTIRVNLWDENGGGFTLCVGEHKGAVYVWLENVVDKGPMSFEELEQES